MKSKLLSLSIALASIVSTVGCRPEVYPYCFGVNEKNMPPKVVLVENSRNAEYYVLNPRDDRIYSHNMIFGDDFLIGMDGKTLNYVSCNNIDGFENVSFFSITRVTRQMRGGGTSRQCDSLNFSATSDDGGVLLDGIDNVPWRWNVFFNMLAVSLRTPAMLDHAEARSGAVVSISPTYAGRWRFWEETPLGDEELYAQDSPDGSPPLIIARVWSFKNTPEMAEAKAYLGIESDEDMLYCGDLYFGYFSR